MEGVKGFNKLNRDQQNILMRVNRKHKAGIGADEKEGFTPIEVVPVKSGILKVKFRNGIWLHYTMFGEWY